MSSFLKYCPKLKSVGLSFLALVAFCLSSIQVALGNIVDSEQDKTQANLPLSNVELTIGVSLQPPFAFVTNGVSDLQGIDIEIIKELQKRTGFKIKNGSIRVMHFSSMMEDGQHGDLDIVAGGVILSEERKEFFDFSETVFSAPFVLVARKDSGIKTLKDLHGRTLATEKGTVASHYIPDADKLNIKIQENLSIFMSMYAVHAHLADAVIMDAPMAHFYINNWKDSNLHIVSHVSSSHPMGLLFKKDAEFTPYLQAALKEMIDDYTVEIILSNFLYLKLK